MLMLVPTAQAQAPTTGRLLVTLRPGTQERARVSAAALARAADARPAGFSVRALRLVTLRPRTSCPGSTAA